MSINVKEVTTKKDLKKWIEFPNSLYKNNEYYVPFLANDEKEPGVKKRRIRILP